MGIEEDERDTLVAAEPRTFSVEQAAGGRPLSRIHLAITDPDTLARLRAQASLTLTGANTTS